MKYSFINYLKKTDGTVYFKLWSPTKVKEKKKAATASGEKLY